MLTICSLRRARRRLAARAGGLAVLAGCDFTPVLDIPLPEHEPAIVLQAVLLADSTVTLRVTRSVDPYRTSQSQNEQDIRETLASATVELFQDGARIETLRLRSQTCTSYLYGSGTEVTYECGPFVSEARVQVGGTYTLRVRAEGFPDAEATATIPHRVEVSEVSPVGDASVSFRVRDPAGLGDHYAVQLSPYIYTETYSYTDCNNDGTVCRDTTVTTRQVFTSSFRTNDPVLLAAARVPTDETLSIVTLDDRPFEGQERTFTIEPTGGRYFDPGGGQGQIEAVWLVTLDEKTYDTYQTTLSPLGDENPFAEPSNLPSNVIGGDGLVGAATIHARSLPEPEGTDA